MLTATAPALPTCPPATSRPCESCRRHPARHTLSWPDATFELCQECIPTDLLDLAVPIAPAGKTSGRPLTPAPDARGLPSADREVFRCAAHTLLTSQPAPRGQRLTVDGGCDVVAALILATGGTVDENGRPTPPAERPAAQLLQHVLAALADHLAAQPWDGDPVALIDAWQASPEVSSRNGAAMMRTLADTSDAARSASSSTPARAGAATSWGSGTVRRPGTCSGVTGVLTRLHH
jgi:hypothetical protein